MIFYIVQLLFTLFSLTAVITDTAPTNLTFAPLTRHGRATITRYAIDSISGWGTFIPNASDILTWMEPQASRHTGFLDNLSGVVLEVKSTETMDPPHLLKLTFKCVILAFSAVVLILCTYYWYKLNSMRPRVLDRNVMFAQKASQFYYSIRKLADKPRVLFQHTSVLAMLRRQYSMQPQMNSEKRNHLAADFTLPTVHNAESFGLPSDSQSKSDKSSKGLFLGFKSTTHPAYSILRSDRMIANEAQTAHVSRRVGKSLPEGMRSDGLKRRCCGCDASVELARVKAENIDLKAERDAAWVALKASNVQLVTLEDEIDLLKKNDVFRRELEVKDKGLGIKTGELEEIDGRTEFASFSPDIDDFQLVGTSRANQGFRTRNESLFKELSGEPKTPESRKFIRVPSTPDFFASIKREMKVSFPRRKHRGCGLPLKSTLDAKASTDDVLPTADGDDADPLLTSLPPSVKPKGIVRTSVSQLSIPSIIKPFVTKPSAKHEFHLPLMDNINQTQTSSVTPSTRNGGTPIILLTPPAADSSFHVKGDSTDPFLSISSSPSRIPRRSSTPISKWRSDISTTLPFSKFVPERTSSPSRIPRRLPIRECVTSSDRLSKISLFSVFKGEESTCAVDNKRQRRKAPEVMSRIRLSSSRTTSHAQQIVSSSKYTRKTTAYWRHDYAWVRELGEAGARLACMHSSPSRLNHKYPSKRPTPPFVNSSDLQGLQVGVMEKERFVGPILESSRDPQSTKSRGTSEVKPDKSNFSDPSRNVEQTPTETQHSLAENPSDTAVKSRKAHDFAPKETPTSRASSLTNTPPDDTLRYNADTVRTKKFLRSLDEASERRKYLFDVAVRRRARVEDKAASGNKKQKPKIHTYEAMPNSRLVNSFNSKSAQTALPTQVPVPPAVDRPHLHTRALNAAAKIRELPRILRGKNEERKYEMGSQDWKRWTRSPTQSVHHT